MATKPRGLGRGLESLLDDSSLFAEYPENESGFTLIPIAKIEPRRDQPRVVFDSEPLEELALSIKEHGVLQPLTVRRLDGEIYQIVAGERRWRAARIAGLDEVPVRIVEADDLAATEIALVENLQRENLNPVEEARGYKVLYEVYGKTQEQIAVRMGKSRPVIANALRLLSLPDELLDMVKSGSLPAGSARALLGIKDTAKLISAAQEVSEKGLSTREAEKLARKISRESSEDANKQNLKNFHDREPRLNYMEEFEKTLSRSWGRKIRIIPGAKGKGRFEIEYYGEDDFEDVYAKLSAGGGGGNNAEHD